MTTALVRRAPTVLVFLLTDAPVAETPAMHVRNALMLLTLLREMHPVLTPFHPELARAARRAEAALVMLEHGGGSRFASTHVTKAIHSLLETDIDWEVVTELPAACSRLFRALFSLWEEVDA